jgi:hypothetical protein
VTLAKQPPPARITLDGLKETFHLARLEHLSGNPGGSVEHGDAHSSAGQARRDRVLVALVAS